MPNSQTSSDVKGAVIGGDIVPDSMASSRIGTEVVGNVNTSGGDFVGRDKSIFAGRDFNAGEIVARTGLPLPQIVDERSPLIEQITTLRGRITRLVPAEEELQQLDPNRATEALSSEQFLDALGSIEAKVAPDITGDEAQLLLQSLNTLLDRVNVAIARLNSTFVGHVHSAEATVELFKTLVAKIGHKELAEEGATHAEAIDRLWKKLDSENITNPGFDVLSDKAYGAMSILAEIKNRKEKVEELLVLDRQRRNLTVSVVIGYIAGALVLMIGLAIFGGSRLEFGKLPLSDMRLPLLGIPWPVIVWSLIGSFAAMIHQFNKKPIHDFGDAVKWLLTRPVQGVVLGSAFYLVLISGLFLFTGTTETADGQGSTADEIILVMSFLVGFSDRFADSVFNALLQRYSDTLKSDQEEQAPTPK